MEGWHNRALLCLCVSEKGTQCEITYKAVYDFFPDYLVNFFMVIYCKRVVGTYVPHKYTKMYLYSAAVHITYLVPYLIYEMLD